MARSLTLHRHRARNTLTAGLLGGILSFAFAQGTEPAAPEPAAADKAAFEAAFQRADSNGDGKLSREEAARLPAIFAKFAKFDEIDEIDEIDTNKDGFLSFDEFSAGVGSMTK